MKQTTRIVKEFLKIKTGKMSGKSLDIKFPIKLLDSNNNKIYFEDFNGIWFKQEFDSNNNKIYYEDSDGIIMDDLTKELSIKEIEELLGYKIKVVK